MIGTGAHLCPLSATEKPQHPCLLSLHRTSESFSTLLLATPNFTVLAVKRERRGCLPNSGSLLCHIPALTSQSCQQLRANDIFDLSGRATPTSDSAVAPRGTRQLILLRVRSSCGTMAAPPQLSQPGEVTWGGQASISRVPGCGDAGCRAEAKWPEERWSDRKMRNRGLRSRRGLQWGWCLLLTVCPVPSGWRGDSLHTLLLKAGHAHTSPGSHLESRLGGSRPGPGPRFCVPAAPRRHPRCWCLHPAKAASSLPSPSHIQDPHHRPPPQLPHLTPRLLAPLHPATRPQPPAQRAPMENLGKVTALTCK